MTTKANEKCHCLYKCSRLPLGYDYITSRNRRLHMSNDRLGKLCPSKNVRSIARIPPSVFETEQEIPQCPNSGAGTRCTLPCASCFPAGKLSRQQEWRIRKKNELYGALTGTNLYSSASFDDMPYHVEFDPCGTPVPMQFGIYILPVSKLGLDEAIYRETWKLQSMLDEAKTPQRVQDTILKMLFGATTTLAADDMTGLGLGALLRYAGETWTGGKHGVQALSTFKGLCNTFSQYGMPKTQRWRLCVGSSGNWHSPVVLGPSREDDYNVRTGLKCKCGDINRLQDASKWSLARDCERCAERCPSHGCSITRKNMVSFEYFPIGPMVAKLCSSRSVCHDLLTMWRNKESWFGRDSSPRHVYKEWWDGYRAAELSFFWDSNFEFELPVLCRACYACYSSYPQKCAELVNPLNWDPIQRRYDFQCSECGCRVTTPPISSKGDPRNLALMAHWDGFQSAKTAHKSTWTLEVQILNAGSRTGIPPIPVLFIPPCDDEDVGRKKVQSLDAFLEPFIRDLEEIFVDGIDMDYNYPAELIQVGLQRAVSEQQTRLRAMLTVFTGDHPAQCKFGGWNTSGHSACRHCKHSSTWVKTGSSGLDGHVKYGDNRRQMRYPPACRNIVDVREGAKKLAQATTMQARKKLSRVHGISAKTRAWRLSDLYGFCLINDLVYDTMHILALCLFKKYCERFVEQTPKRKEDLFEEALEEVTARRPAGFDGRWPKKPFSRLGYFKAEEYTRFIIFCVPHILSKLDIGIETPIAAIGLLLVEIARLFYIKSRAEGWTRDSLEQGRRLLSSWRVRSEEAWGANAAILEHVAGSGEIFSGIERHGPHYVYWCYGFERLVADYGRTRTNQKEMEMTFSQHFARRFFTKVSAYIWQDDDGLFPHQRCLLKVHNSLRVTRSLRKEHKKRSNRCFECPEWHSNCVAVVSSQDLGCELWEGMSMSVEEYKCKDVVLTKGVGIGSKRLTYTKLSPSATCYLRQYWKDWAGRHSVDTLESDFQDHCTPLRAAVWRKQVFRVGDSVVVLVDGSSDGTSPANWKAKVTKFFMHEFKGHMQLFFEAEWYKQVFDHDGRGKFLRWEVDEYSLFTVLQTKLTVGYGNNCRPLSRILHKFFPIHRTRRGALAQEVMALEIGDTLSRDLPVTIAGIPPFPEVGDIMSSTGRTNGQNTERLSLCVVREIITETNERGTRPDGAADTESPDLQENEEIESASNSDGEEIEEQLNRDQEDIHVLKTRSVMVSWLTVVMPRMDIPEYKAASNAEQELEISQLVELKSDFRITRVAANGNPVRWS